MLAPLEPALLRALQQDGTSRALYGVLTAVHVGLARHGEVAVAAATPDLFAAMPRLMAQHVILLDAAKPTKQSAANGGGDGGYTGGGVDMEVVLPLLGTAPHLLAPLLDRLADVALEREGGALRISGTENPRVTAVAPAVRALAAARCLQCIFTAEKLRLAGLAAEESVKHMLDVLAKVPGDDVTMHTAAALRTLCDALRNSAQDAFGRGL